MKKRACKHESRVSVEIRVGTDPYTGKDKFVEVCPPCGEKLWFAVSK